jgi:hypothetical protein
MEKMKNLIYATLVFFVVSSCIKCTSGEKKVTIPENNSGVQDENLDLTKLDLPEDSIFQIEGFQLEFSESSKDEFDKYSDNIFTDKSNKIKGKRKVPANIYINELLASPKMYAKENLYPIVNWNQKLSTFLDAERVAENLARAYGGDYIEVDSTSTDEDDNVPQGNTFDVKETRSIEMVWFAMQDFGILKDKYFSRRDSTTIEVFFPNGKTRRFTNSYTDSIYFHFIGYYYNINSYIIEEKSPTKIAYKVINRETGEEFEAWGFPNFWHKSVKSVGVLSVLSSSNIYTPEKKRGFQLFNIQQNKMKKLLEFEMKEYNSPTNIAFIDSNTAIIEVNFIEEGCPDYAYFKMKIIKK